MVSEKNAGDGLLSRIALRKFNLFLFICMFLTFVFAAKTSIFLGLRVVGLEYYLWIAFFILLSVLNFGFANSPIHIRSSYFILASVLLVFCVLNFFAVQVSGLQYLQGAFFSFLFVANFILFSNLQFRKDDFFFLARIVVFTITLIGILSYLERIFIVGEYKSYFLRGVSTVTKDSSFTAGLLNINIVLCLALYLVARRRIYVYIILFSIITIALFLFIKAFLSALIICFVFVRIYFNSWSLKTVLYGLAVLFFSVLIFIGKPLYNEIEKKAAFYFGEGYTKAPRNALYISSFKIARDYFPFGCGQGTFGSWPVGKTYSRIYYDYHLDKVQGLSREDALGLTNSQFVFDTHWSSVIGEMGFIAGLVDLWLWLLPAIICIRYLKRGNNEIRAIAFAVIMMTISIFIESVAAPFPNQLQFIMLYAGLGAIGFRLVTRKENMNPSAK